MTEEQARSVCRGWWMEKAGTRYFFANGASVYFPRDAPRLPVRYGR